jgi:hypothetical protein
VHHILISGRGERSEDHRPVEKPANVRAFLWAMFFRAWLNASLLLPNALERGLPAKAHCWRYSCSECTDVIAGKRAPTVSLLTRNGLAAPAEGRAVWGAFKTKGRPKYGVFGKKMYLFSYTN